MVTRGQEAEVGSSATVVVDAVEEEAMVMAAKAAAGRRLQHAELQTLERTQGSKGQD